MASVWGIHGRRPNFELLRDRVIALERAGVGDLGAVGNDRARVMERLRASYPDREQTPDGTLRNWTTVLLRFAFEPVVGDLVVHPDPRSRTVGIGRIAGDYRFEATPRELHLRDVEWAATGVPRDQLSDEARQAISQRLAFFEVLAIGDEFGALAAEPIN